MYWRLLSEAASWEVIAHRLIWSPLVILALLLLRGKCSGIAASVRLLAREHRQLFFLFCAAGFAALNWWINVVAVQQARVVELGIGMFLTPLMSICFGVVLFGKHWENSRPGALRQQVSALRCSSPATARSRG